MTYEHGWLVIEEGNGQYKELFNNARTASYLRASSVLGCGTIYNVLVDAGCPAYRYEPLNTDGVITWTQRTFVSPLADSAPWYNAAYPESAKALGFWVSEWTGLDSGHVKRQSTPVGAYRGGSVLGPASNSGRVMGFEVILLAESEVAMEYLFRWLDATLTSVCSTCASDTILIRRYCPDISVSPGTTSANGVAELRGVGMVEGSVWGAPPVEQAGCYIRRVNFTLEATDPCMYSPCTDETVDQEMGWNDCFDGANLNPARTECRPSCSEMDSGCRTVYSYDIDTVGASAPRVVLTAPSSGIIDGVTVSGSIPVRIRTYANPLGLGADAICGAPLLAELYLTSLPAYSSILYDMAGRTVQVHDAASGGWVNGFAYVAPNQPGIPRFPALGCGEYMTIIEPSDFCVTREPVPTWGFDTATWALASSPSYVFVGGQMTNANSVTANNMAAVTRVGGLLWPGFNTDGTIGTNGTVSASVVQPDGKIIIAGAFTTARGTTVNRIIRLLANGAVDPTWDLTGTVGFDGALYALALQSDGKVIVGGAFTNARGTAKNNIARLNSNGSLDSAFNTGGTVGVNGTVYALALQADGKVIVGGSFVAARGTTQNNIARLGTDGALDGAFNTGGTVGVSSTVRALALQADGKVIVGGAFATARGTTQNGIARLTTAGALDGAFNTGGTVGVEVGTTVFAVALQSDGKVIIGGAFTTARGSAALRLARLTTAGALDGVFTDSAGAGTGLSGGTNNANALLVEGDYVYVAGEFTTVNATTRTRLARFSTATRRLDENFPHSQLLPNGIGIPSVELSLQERLGCA